MVDLDQLEHELKEDAEKYYSSPVIIYQAARLYLESMKSQINMSDYSDENRLAYNKGYLDRMHETESKQSVDVESLKRDIASELYDQNDDERWSLSWADNRLIDYLNNTGRLATIPDGFVLVPREPTDLMVDGWKTAWQSPRCPIETCKSAYRAMIAALPKHTGE